MIKNSEAIPCRLDALVTPAFDFILQGDNVAMMKTFDKECIDLTVTSPPYDRLKTYGGHQWDFEAVATELFRVTKKGGVLVWVVADSTVKGSESGTSFRQALFFRETGFNLHDTMIYRKRNFMPLTHKRYEQAFEFMFVFSKGRPKTWNPLKVPIAYPRTRTLKMRDGDGKKTGFQCSGTHRIKENVWDYKVGGGHIDSDGLAHLHPAPFPEKLAEDHIASWSNPGELVLDPFSGSGTTCKAAKRLGRHFIGIEINSEYVELSKRRLG